MKKLGLPMFFFLFGVLLFAVNVSAQTFSKSDFLQKVETRVDITSAYTHYRVCNPAVTDYSISKASDFSVSFNEFKGKLTSYRFTKLENVSYEVDDFIEYCNNDSIEVAGNDTNGTAPYNQTITTCNREKVGSHKEYRDEWKEFSLVGTKFKAGQCYDIKVEGTYPAAYKDNPVAIDNVISYAGYDYTEYDWWNVTWQKKYQINVNATASAPYYPFRIVLQPTSAPELFQGSQPDGGDIRIVNGTNNGVVPFNLSIFNTTHAVIYINSSLKDQNFSGYIYFNASSVQTTTSAALTELTLQSDVARSYTIDDGNVSGNIAIDLKGVVNLTKTNGAYGVAGKIRQAINATSGNSDWTGWGQFDLTNSNTFNLWIKPDDPTPSSIQQIYYREGLTSSAGWYGLRQMTNGSTHYSFCQSNVCCNMYTTAVPEDGAWHMITAIRNGTQGAIYLDGVLKDSQTCSANTIGNAGYVLHFLNYEGTQTWYYGGVDELNYFARPLTQTEINALYAGEYGTGYPFYATPSYTVGAVSYSSIMNETVGRTAIEAGIANALSGNYTIYTDQQVYGRHVNGTQMVGTFDKFVVYSGTNQRWAFNYNNESTGGFTHMFNITPVFYVLELSNTTENNLTTTVQNFITSTKLN